MSFTVLIHESDQKLQVHENDLSALDDLSPSSVVWIDIESQDTEEVSKIAEYFDLHELTVEDCLTPGHFPKIDDYGAYLFMIFRGLKNWSDMETIWERTKEDLPIEEEDDVEESFSRKISIYLSQHFIVTHRRKEVSWLDAIVRQVQQYPDRFIEQGTEVIAHKVIDVLVDRFMRNLSFFDDIIDRFEDLSIEQHDEFDISDLLELKHNLTSLVTLLRNQRTITAKLAGDQTLIQAKMRRRYFKDIDDHAQTLLILAQKQVENTLSLRDTYFAMANVRLGDIMRILAVITTVATPIHIVVGLYGMNFEAIPLLHNPNGFWFIIFVMGMLAVCMLVYFRRQRWI
jgi:magnesium transporter